MLSQMLLSAVKKIAYISRTDTTTSGAATLVINTPTGATINDTLLAFLTTTSARTITAPGGWSLVASPGPTTTPAGNVRGYVYGLTLSAAPAASYTFTNSATSAMVGSLVCIRSTQPVTVNSAVFSQTTQTGTTSTAPTITAATTSLLICSFHLDAATFTTLPSGFATTYQVNEATSPKSLGVAIKTVQGGPTGTTTATHASSNWNAASVLLT